jgi:hypothetical protein
MKYGGSMKIFWSWQSDTHQPSGRHFIRDVLQQLCEELAETPEIEPAERPEIDHDTLDVAGSPPIAETILRKIRDSAVFVADVTPVATTKGGKHAANPNVMIELGYALAILGHERIVLVMNTAEGAVLKHLPFDLRHWRKPISYSLGRDAADERRVEVKTELVGAFRQAVVPSLKVAIAVERERDRRITREPALGLVFEQGAEQKMLLKIAQQVALPDVKTLDEVRQQTPLLSLSAAKRQNLVGPTANSLGSILSPSLRWNVQEIEGYNRLVSGYYSQWQRYLDELSEWSLAIQRIFEVRGVLANSGTAPATNIDVELVFPTGILLFEDDKLPTKPEAPDPPPFMPFGPGRSFARPVALNLDLTSMLSTRPRSTFIYADQNTVRFHSDGLKHGHHQKIATFRAGFATGEDIGPFVARYTITANEPIDPIYGDLSFEVEVLPPFDQT